MEYRLKNIGRIVTGKTPSTKKNGYFSNQRDKYMFLTPRDMNVDSKYIRHTERYLTDDVTQNFYKIILNKDSVCISCIGSDMGKVFLIDKPTISNQQINSITEIKKVCNPEYLYYYFKDKKEYLKSIAGGSTMPILKKSDFENIIVELPERKVQDKIVQILGLLDKKIELNNQINNNYLEIINCLYNKIFNDLDIYDKAENIANITIGKTPPRSNRECFTTNTNDMKWISISDLGKSDTYIFNTSERLTKEAIDKYKVKIIPKGTIILSFKLTVGRVAITTEDMATNEAIAHFNLKNEGMKYYLYTYLKNFDYTKLGSTSSIATAVNSKIIKAMPIGIPNEVILERYNKKVKSIFNKILENEKENEVLEQLRDTLLPKLMNGEIDMENIEF